jgi:hypothetical protein
MRVKDVFSAFPRKLKPGKADLHCRRHGENGGRSSGLSAGQAAKMAARACRMRLYRDGNLFPRKRRIPTFEGYAAPWRDWGACGRLKNQKVRKGATQAHADTCRKTVKNHILPASGKHGRTRSPPRALTTGLPVFSIPRCNPDKNKYVYLAYILSFSISCK